MAPLSPIHDLPWSATHQPLPTDQSIPTIVPRQENFFELFGREIIVREKGWDRLGGAIAGIVVGSIVFAFLVGFLVHYIVRRRQSRKPAFQKSRYGHRRLSSPDLEKPPMAVVKG